MQQMLDMLVQQSQQLMEQVQALLAAQGAQPMIPQERPATVKPSPPAEYSGAAEQGFETWKNRVNEWKSIHCRK